MNFSMVVALVHKAGMVVAKNGLIGIRDIWLQIDGHFMTRIIIKPHTHLTLTNIDINLINKFNIGELYMNWFTRLVFLVLFLCVLIIYTSKLPIEEGFDGYCYGISERDCVNSPECQWVINSDEGTCQPRTVWYNPWYSDVYNWYYRYWSPYRWYYYNDYPIYYGGYPYNRWYGANRYPNRQWRNHHGGRSYGHHSSGSHHRSYGGGSHGGRSYGGGGHGSRGGGHR